MTDDELLDHLDKLRAEATPGPWEATDNAVWGETALSLVATKLAPQDDRYLVALVNAHKRLVRLARRGRLLHEGVFGRCKYCGEEILPLWTCGCAHG